MNEVAVHGKLPIAHQVAETGNRGQHRFHFCAMGDRQEYMLHVTEEPYHGLYRLWDERSVIVSTWQADGLCHFSRLSLGEFLALSGLLGLTQAHAVITNPVLRIEDFIHPREEQCLFSTLPLKQEFATILDEGSICRGCLEFYRCLKLEPEIDALLTFLDSLQRNRDTRDAT
jgi:hypothetical protein